MADKQWHLVENGQQLSERFSTDEIAERIQADPTTNRMVWRQGMDGWKAPDQLPEFKSDNNKEPDAQSQADQASTDGDDSGSDKTHETVDKIKHSGRQLARGTAAKFQQIKNTDDPMATMPYLRFADSLLDIFRGFLSRKTLDTIDDLSKKFGVHAFGIAALFLALIYLTGMFKGGDLSINGFLMPFYVLGGGLIGQYLIASFSGHCATLLEKTPSRIGSRTLLECFAMVAIGIGIFVFITTVVQTIDMQSLSFALKGLVTAAIAAYIAGICLNEDVVNVRTDHEATLSEEGIGILYFFLKVGVRIVPVVFGLFAITAMIVLIYAFVRGLFAEGGGRWFGLAFGEQVVLIYIALLPILVYVTFLVQRLFVAMIEAILSIPDRLDNLRQD